MKRLLGVMTALVTPFIEDQWDEAGFIENIRFQLNAGIQGVVILGTTGESATLTEEERERIIRCTVATVAGRVPVIVGCGDNATHRAIAKMRRAQELGANFALVVTPYYNRPTQEGLFQHFRAIAQATDLPFFLYNNPIRTGVNAEPETLRRLFEFSSFVGVKEEFVQIGVVKHLSMRHRPDFMLFSGNDSTTLPEMALGAHGVISTVGNLVPREMVALVTAMLQGRYEEARQAHYRLLPLFQAVLLETNPAPIKAAMNYCGMPAGPCRLPLAPLSRDNLMKLERVLQALDLCVATGCPS
jgi:4-hydroxy-tetrahydrodipicolinate synthase